MRFYCLNYVVSMVSMFDAKSKGGVLRPDGDNNFCVNNI